MLRLRNRSVASCVHCTAQNRKRKFDINPRIQFIGLKHTGIAKAIGEKKDSKGAL